MTIVEVAINCSAATETSPANVFGTVRHPDGTVTPFGGWLSLLSVLQAAAAEGPGDHINDLDPF